MECKKAYLFRVSVGTAHAQVIGFGTNRVEARGQVILSYPQQFHIDIDEGMALDMNVPFCVKEWRG